MPNLPAQFWAFFQILEHEKLDLGIESQHNRLINLYIVFCKLLDDITETNIDEQIVDLKFHEFCQHKSFIMKAKKF